jgi:tight adherence protein B
MYWWGIAALFGISGSLLGYLLLKALRDVEESYAGEYTADTAQQFEDLFLFISPVQMLQITRIAAFMAFVGCFFMVGNISTLLGVVRGAVLGGMVGIAVLFFPRLLLKIMKQRRLERFNRQLVDALTNMSNALKAGFSVQQAFEAIVQERQNPISQEFGVFLHQLQVGVKFEDALADMDRRMASEDLSLMVLSIETARQTGGNLTEVFEKISETIRERMRIEGKIKSITAMGRMQGRVVSAMPFFLGSVMYFIDRDMMLSFVRSFEGIALLVLVVLMITCGSVLIRKIVTIDV